MPSLQKLSEYIKWWQKHNDMPGQCLHAVWETFYPSHKDKLNDSDNWENPRNAYQDEVSKKCAEFFEEGFNHYLVLHKFPKSAPRVYIKGLTTAQMATFGKMRRCDTALVDERTVTERGTNSVTSGSNDNAPHRGTSSSKLARRVKPSEKEMITLRQAAGTSATPTIFHPQGPSSDSAATLAFTLKQLTFPTSTEGSLTQVQLELTWCRHKDDKLNAQGESAQTLSEFLQRFHIPKETWDSELNSLVKEQWQSNPEEKKPCVSGYGPSQRKLKTRLGHAIARYISEKSNLDNQISVQYLQPETYNILMSRFPSYKTFPFNSVDKDGSLPKVSHDKNKQLPSALR